MLPRLEKLVAEWLAVDQNPSTRAEIEELVAANDESELERRLGSRITFGTAGLRARMEAGFARMNDVTVIQASQGLAAYILAQSGDNNKQLSVVIGHDHRHNSARFARLTTAAMVSAGIKVYFYETLVHTPLVPFGVTMLGASAGVMVTASHNPAKDNGYKVYWGSGCQIVPPHDKGIAQAIEENLSIHSWDVDVVEKGGKLVDKPLARVWEEYFKAIAAIATIGGGKRDDVRFVYTPMHGVGLSAMKRVVADMGLERNMHIVPEQADPNPDFPTVRFPNPEESGALDLAISLASSLSIRLVLASDPDADRFAAAQLLPSGGGWRIFTGNELGILFAAHVLDTYRLANPGIHKLSKLTMLCSTVSSQMLRYMAAAEGFRFEETLTGFKWLGSRARDLSTQEQGGYNALYAFEEAIGYMFTPVVHDKDGITAAGVFLRMLAVQPDLYAKLQELYAKYGYFQSANSYFVSPDPTITTQVFAQIRALGGGDGPPQKVGDRNVTWWRDLTVGYDSKTHDGVPLLPTSRNSEMITCELEGDVRFTVRGSGTEPKIKMYIECKANSEEAARQRAQEVSRDLTREWFRPEETGLVPS